VNMLNNLPGNDRIIIAGDLELIREFGIMDAQVVYTETCRKALGD